MTSANDHSSMASAFAFMADAKHLSQHERDVFNSIVDRLPDHELFMLLQERRRWNPRNSTSTNSMSTSRSSALSFESMPSLRGSSISSQRESLMSLDDFQITDNNVPNQDHLDYSATSHAPQNDAAKHQDHADRAPEPLATQARPRANQATKCPKRYFCTYCPQETRPGFVRRSDWKKHETSEHEPGKLYVCAHSKDTHEPCRKWYYSRKPLQEHHRTAHEIIGCSRRNCVVRESQKMIFACGFKDCTAIFIDETNDCKDAWFDRCKHIGDHFESDGKIDDWSYSQMMFNLLEQPILSSLWRSTFTERNYLRGFASKPTSYEWDPTTTSALRVSLETAAYKNADKRLDLHQNAIKLLRDLYNAAQLTVPSPSSETLRASSSDLLDTSYDFQDDFDYSTLNYDDLLVPLDAGTDASSLTPIFNPGSVQQTALPSSSPPLRAPALGQYTTAQSQQRASSSPFSDVQQLTADLLREQDAWY